jgi:hypothetical protein
MHHIGSNAQPVDVLALTEMLDTNNNSVTSSTLPALVNALNAIYGPGYYAYDNTPDPTSGGTQFNGPSGLIYNTHTVQVVPGSEKALAYSGDNTNSVPRAPMRYTLQPVGYGSNADFYLYASHYKASSGSSNETTPTLSTREISISPPAAANLPMPRLPLQETAKPTILRLRPPHTFLLSPTIAVPGSTCTANRRRR